MHNIPEPKAGVGQILANVGLGSGSKVCKAVLCLDPSVADVEPHSDGVVGFNLLAMVFSDFTFCHSCAALVFGLSLIAQQICVCSIQLISPTLLLMQSCVPTWHAGLTHTASLAKLDVQDLKAV